MKSKYYSKYVFQPHGRSCFYLKNDGRMLAELFPELDFIFTEYTAVHIAFTYSAQPALAWRDKHNNIIVRIHHADTQQKLNL